MKMKHNDTMLLFANLLPYEIVNCVPTHTTQTKNEWKQWISENCETAANEKYQRMDTGNETSTRKSTGMS